MTTVSFLLTATLLATPALLPIASAPPREATSPSAKDVVITTPYYTLHASAGNKADAEMLAHTLDDAIGRMTKDYAAADGDALLRSASVEVRIADVPNEHCGIGQAEIMTDTNTGKYNATIHLLAPSAHPRADAPNAPRTLAGEPQDAAYCQRVLVHEYSTVLLDKITRAKKSGWRLFSAPEWFVQGTEEYFGVMYSTKHAATVTLQRYIEMTRRDNLVTNDFGIEVQSPYVAGPVLIAFLHERFGPERFVALLSSEEATFGKAIRATLHTTPDELFAAWQEWLRTKPTDGAKAP